MSDQGFKSGIPYEGACAAPRSVKRKLRFSGAEGEVEAQFKLKTRKSHPLSVGTDVSGEPRVKLKRS